ncbi:MAG: isoprenylcysteine carboxylmethyltransferase family protein [Candidatus Eisenbacteria bacterium]|nr:isoprenylcysteine carboxylmethyltransferase family protein [Candidatus Eisenbacteria bacterium]
MSLTAVVSWTIALWPVAEMAFGLRHRAHGAGAQTRDRGTLGLLWIVITLSVTAAIFAQRVPAGRIPIPERAAALAALGLIVPGLALRIASIMTLGRFFTVDVAVHAGHRVVREGPYRWLRHPSYAGALLALLGMALLSRNAISAMVLMLPITMALLTRIRIEEQALREALGTEYEQYCRRTRRLLPGVY